MNHVFKIIWIVQIDEYDVTNTPRSRDVTNQLWWRHNAKSLVEMAQSATDDCF